MRALAPITVHRISARAGNEKRQTPDSDAASFSVYTYCCGEWDCFIKGLSAEERSELELHRTLNSGPHKMRSRV